MTSTWWLLVAFVAGGWAGILLIALMRTTSDYSGIPHEGRFAVSDSVAPSVDVEDVGLVQQLVQVHRGERLIAGEKLSPVLDRLVGRADESAGSPWD